jgi:hypothetical protein
MSEREKAKKEREEKTNHDHPSKASNYPTQSESNPPHQRVSSSSQ